MRAANLLQMKFSHMGILSRRKSKFQPSIVQPMPPADRYPSTTSAGHDLHGNPLESHRDMVAVLLCFLGNCISQIHSSEQVYGHSVRRRDACQRTVGFSPH